MATVQLGLAMSFRLPKHLHVSVHFGFASPTVSAQASIVSGSISWGLSRDGCRQRGDGWMKPVRMADLVVALELEYEYLDLSTCTTSTGSSRTVSYFLDHTRV